MKNDQIFVTLANITLSCRLRYPETAGYFQKPGPDASCVGTGSVCLSDDDWDFFLHDGAMDAPHTEYSLLTAPLSDALMEFDRFIFHAVALRWRDRAWLIAAPSGVGKSTQARALQQLRPGEFSVISGDRPILEFCPATPAPRPSERSEESVSSVPFHRNSERSEESVPPSSRHSERSEESASPVPERSAPVAAHSVRHSADQSILVHPSPWNGKENWHGAEAAPLAGLILLSRGPENRLTALTDREAALTMYQHFLQSAWEPENIRRVAALETRLLRAVPIWLLESDQVPDSTRLLLDAVFPAEQPGPSKKAGVP